MTYDFTIATPQKRHIAVLMRPIGWEENYHILHKNTEISLYEEWAATAHNNFSNPFAKENERLYKQRGPWAIITRDKILRGGPAVGNGLRIKYISHAGTEWERDHET